MVLAVPAPPRPGCCDDVAPGRRDRAARIPYAVGGPGHPARPPSGRSRSCRRAPASWCRPVDGRLVKAATFASHEVGAGPDASDADVARRCGPRSGATGRSTALQLRRRRPGRAWSSPTSPTPWLAVARAAGRRPGDPLGRRPAAVRRRATSTGWRGSAPRVADARARGVRRGVRRRRRPGLHRQRRGGRRPGAAPARCSATMGPWIQHPRLPIRARRRRRLSAQRPRASTRPSATRCGRCSRSPAPLGADDRAPLAAEVEELVAQLAEKDVVVRGTYDVAGLRADADLMLWWHAETSDAPAGRLRPVPPHGARRRLRPGVVADGAAPAGGVQQAPRAGVHVRRGAARATSASTRSCAPTSGTCCPTRSAARCSPSTARWRATTPTYGPTRWRRSPSATTSGCSRSRPTSCTASST